MKFFNIESSSFNGGDSSKKNEKSLSSKIFNLIELITKIVSFVTICFVYLVKYINYFDVIKASNFYGIPISYFSEDPLLDSIVIKFLVFIIPLFIFLMPALSAIVFKDAIYSKFELVMMSFSNSLLLLMFFIDVIIYPVITVFENQSVGFQIVISLVVFFIICLILTFLNYLFYSGLIFTIDDNSSNLKSESADSEVKFKDKVKSKLKENNVGASIYMIVITIFILLFSVNKSEKIKLNKNYDIDRINSYEIIIKNNELLEDENTANYDKDKAIYCECFNNRKTYYDEIAEDEPEVCKVEKDSEIIKYKKDDSTFKENILLDIIAIRKDKNAVTIKGYIKDKKLYILKGQYRMESIEDKDILYIKDVKAKFDDNKIEKLVEKEKSNK